MRWLLGMVKSKKSLHFCSCSVTDSSPLFTYRKLNQARNFPWKGIYPPAQGKATLGATPWVNGYTWHRAPGGGKSNKRILLLLFQSAITARHKPRAPLLTPLCPGLTDFSLSGYYIKKTRTAAAIRVLFYMLWGNYSFTNPFTRSILKASLFQWKGA